jgi:hypothetical protein
MASSNALIFRHCACRYPFSSNQAIPPMDWEEYVSEICSDIMREQSPKRFGITNILCRVMSDRK